MKKFFMIAGVILAIMMVVQPTYAATKHFNIVVTISEFSMELLTSDGMNIYNEWPITIPPGAAITMTAEQAVMVSLTGEVPENVDIKTHISNMDGWQAVMPDHELTDNEFVLEVATIHNPADLPTLANANFVAITDATEAPAGDILNTGGLPAAAWLIYKFKAGPHYDQPNAGLEVKIEVLNKP
jgi:hypothetical protein